jgi:hypothetical protein
MDFLMPIVKTTVLYIHKPKWLTGKYRITMVVIRIETDLKSVGEIIKGNGRYMHHNVKSKRNVEAPKYLCYRIDFVQFGQLVHLQLHDW